MPALFHFDHLGQLVERWWWNVKWLKADYEFMAAAENRVVVAYLGVTSPAELLAIQKRTGLPAHDWYVAPLAWYPPDGTKLWPTAVNALDSGLSLLATAAAAGVAGAQISVLGDNGCPLVTYEFGVVGGTFKWEGFEHLTRVGKNIFAAVALETLYILELPLVGEYEDSLGK